jgi:hypothetical protein
MRDEHGDKAPQYRAPMGDLQEEFARSLANALGEIAFGMNDLTDRIDRAADAIEEAMIVRSSQVEIAKLFVRAQQFIDRAVREAQRQAAQMLAEAHAEAERIVAAERLHTQQLIVQAPLDSFVSAEAIQQVAQTIDSFTRSNSELTDELAQLRRGGEPAAEEQNQTEPRNGASG